ncbi:MAG: VOC family protein [Deltaproteobacteria bacterium]|nr:VOC family protein [Deltaproteobacteria bacterium]
MPTPYLIASPASEAIDFYARVFGAREHIRLAMPDGRIGHADLSIRDGTLMLAYEFPEQGFASPKRLGGSPVELHLLVPDVDATHARACAAGATEKSAPENQVDGERRSSIVDLFGHVWLLATRREELAPDEIVRRFHAAMSKGEIT